MSEAKKPKKKIAFAESTGDMSKDRTNTRVYRKSIMPNLRESFMMAGLGRESSAHLFGPSMMESRRFTSRRSTMYLTPRFQNTYQLESRYPFNRERAQTMMNHYMQVFLDGFHYNPKRARRSAENLSASLRDLIKQCHFERYRVVSYVTIGDKMGQSFKSAFRNVWDPEKDGIVTYSHDAPSFFLVAFVCAIYYE
ncbi:dynein light chain Tctex-type protein 2B-like [Uranotaenia lowii]|uniref:dynein light chain Tctex-type protein 2B-like n=1 Tax=Uranotaenia lowii TaxID=190385 RepID=UPI00247ADF31|nr:dynein light chain Tctex-type protein 2B-like [Uranotaenia lowii]